MSDRKQHDLVFIMFKQWETQIKMLTNEQRGVLLTAIYDYQCDGKDLKTDDKVLAMIWSMIKQGFEENERKYREICELNREKANRRWHKNDAEVCSGTIGTADNAI